MELAGRPKFGALLRRFRLESGMTQQDLADRSKLSVEAIGALERGVRTRPQRETLALLASALALPEHRERLLRSAIDAAHPPRRRECSTANPSLLRMVHSNSEAAPGNLPQQLTSFVGRDRELGEITTLLRRHRLVTIVGAGGVGKTRIVVQLGHGLFGEYPDGIFLVDLAPLAEGAHVPGTVISALELPSSVGSELGAAVAYLKPRRALVIFDNCEHVVAAIRDIASGIARVMPPGADPCDEPAAIGGRRRARLSTPITERSARFLSDR